MSETQLEIPYVRHSRTSKEAAERIKGFAARQRSIVLEFIMEHGPVSDQEIENGLGMSGNSARPRRIELAESGKIVKHPEDGKSLSGRPVRRWIAINSNR